MEEERQRSIQELIYSLIKGQESSRKVQFSEGDIAEQLRTKSIMDGLDKTEELEIYCHQNRSLSKVRRKMIQQFVQSGDFDQSSYKYVLLLASQANILKLQNQNYYAQFETLVSSYPPKFFICIDKDVPRTLGSSNELQQPLKRVLYAYAIRNPSLCYCQGLNYLVVFLLMNGLTEQQSFWFLVALIENILPDDYYKDLGEIMMIVDILEHVLTHKFPSFMMKLKQQGIEVNLFLLSWFVCLFTKQFVNTVANYLLCTFLLQSRYHNTGFVLLRIALAVLQTMIKKNNFQFGQNGDGQLKWKCQIQTMILQTRISQIRNSFASIKLSESSYLKLQKIYAKQRQKQRNNSILRAKNSAKLKLPACEPYSPLCLYRLQLQHKISLKDTIEIMSSDVAIDLQIQQDYFKLGKPVRNYQPKMHKTGLHCVFVRHKHLCQNLKNSQNVKSSILASNDPLLPPKEILQDSSLSRISKSLQLDDFIQQISSRIQIQNQPNPSQEDQQEIKNAHAPLNWIANQVVPNFKNFLKIISRNKI